MTKKEQIEHEAMRLPINERAELAHALWESIEEGFAGGVAYEGQSTIAEALRRDAELSRGNVAGRTHEKVMEAAKDALRPATGL